ncbi:MAG: hypothetical protein WBZ54_16545 [Methylocella sp.]
MQATRSRRAASRLRPWASDFHIVFIVFGLAMPLLFLAHVKTGRRKRH